MGQRIKTFADGSFLEYDQGKFDGWCVYLNRNGGRTPPRDADYFGLLKQLAGRYGADRIYRDYIKVYDWTEKQVNQGVLDAISRLAAGYGSDALTVDIVFSILYLAMIAEEQKQNTKLGKRIKRLGVHCLLMEGRSVDSAATFMNGMKWQEIDRLCRARGF